MAPQQERPTALLVEDDDVIRECVAGWLADEGWAVEAHPTAEAGLAAAKTLRPQLAVVDVKLAGTYDGVWLAAQLQAAVPSTRVFFATGIDDLPGAATLRANISGYLVKPYSRRDLRHGLATLSFAPSAVKPAAAWPPAALDDIKGRRYALLAKIREVLAHSFRANERMAAALLPGEDPARLGALSRQAAAVAKSFALDAALIPEIERAMCFSQIGRRVYPESGDVPGLSTREALELIELGYPEESRWAMSALGMPVAGELVARLSPTYRADAHQTATPSSMEMAVRILRGMLVWREAIDGSTSRGYAPKPAAVDAMMRLRDPHSGVDPRIADAIDATNFREDGAAV